jgi:hypothetical protein
MCRLLFDTAEGGKLMDIQILGPGCANCLKLEMLVMETLTELGIREGRKNFNPARNGAPDIGQSSESGDQWTICVVGRNHIADEATSGRMDSRSGDIHRVRTLVKIASR